MRVVRKRGGAARVNRGEKSRGEEVLQQHAALEQGSPLCLWSLSGQTDDRSIVPRTDGVSRGRRQSRTGPPTPLCGGFLLIKFLCCPLDGSSEPDC